MDRFTELLTELGAQVGIPLHPDKRGVCKLNINGALHVQLENDLRKDALLIAAFVGEITPGKFRENILREGLKANNDVRDGVLAFSGKNNQLSLFKYHPMKNLQGQELLGIINAFLDKAMSWRQALESGVIPAAKKL